jgi:pimeloyl-ACP methyl ester carboxylesterase
MSGRLREQAFLLGARKSLVGVLTEGADTGAPVERPTIVILNAGIIHRVGPGRLTVLLARTLAAQGFTVLRFDLSGLGDSEARADGLAPLEATLSDIREVLDWLESARGARRIVLAGLCSGANHSLLYSGTDPRVVGVVLLDPATPRTRLYYIRHYLPRLFRWHVWLNLLRGRHPRMQRLARSLGARGEVKASVREEREAWMPDLQGPEVHAELERAYKAALGQGVQFLMAFTSGLEEQHNYREQVLHAFPGVAFGDRLRLEYFEGAEHTFTAVADRARLFRLVSEWARDTRFGT